MTDEALSLCEKSNVAKPIPASVAKKASCLPGMSDNENGRRPPAEGVALVKSGESVPSEETSHVARKPGVGGTPLTETVRREPSALKMTSERVIGGPLGGVVWLRPRARVEFDSGINPALESAMKQLNRRQH